MLDLVATLFALSAEYLKTHKEDVATKDTQAFQNWLRDEAFPKLIDQSEQTLRSTIALRSAEHERFASIMDLLRAIRSAVSGKSAADRWAELRPEDQILLKHLHAHALTDPLVILDRDDLLRELGGSDDSLRSAAKFLDEKGLGELGESIGGWWLMPTRSGVELASEIETPGSYSTAAARLGKALPPRTEIGRLFELAEASNTAFGLTYFIVKGWQENGLLNLEENASPFEYSSVWNVSESLRRQFEVT